MTVDNRISLIYDTVYYFIRYYNEEYLAEKHKCFNTEHSDECYFFIKSRFMQLPNLFLPLFNVDSGENGPSVMTNFFSNNYLQGLTSVEDCNPEQFTGFVTDNKQLLYNCLLDFYFTRGTGSVDYTVSVQAFTDRIFGLDISDRLKTALVMLLWKFDYAVELFCDTFKAVYEAVEILHKKNLDLIRVKAEELNSDEISTDLSRYYGFSVKSLDKAVAGISLLNQRLIFGSVTDSQSVYILGLKHREAIDVINGNKDIDPVDFLVIIGNKTRIEILRTISKNEEMTVTQISKAIGCPLSSTIRFMEPLEKSSIVYMSRKDGLQYFYKINRTFFMNAIDRMSELLKNIIDS